MANPAAEIPTHLSRYRLELELGRGGMGVVYRAYDRLAQQFVAVKRIEADVLGRQLPSARSSAVTWRLPPLQDLTRMPTGAPFAESGSVSGDEQLRTALAREFRILASLRHPNIISVLNYGFDTHNRPYLVMELLDAARPVDDAVYNLEQRQKALLVVQIIQALRYLHRAGVVHRDLKPENVLVVQQDGELLVKLVDFGLAVARTHLVGLDVAGTLAYMAPELILGAAPSMAADIYALGVILFELMAERHPFSDMEMGELISASRRGEVDFDEPDLPDDARMLVKAMMAPRPSDRPGEMEDVLAMWCASMRLELPLEPAEVRNSFLEAASFVARETELKQLMKAMRRAAAGRGSSWLLSGVSGVGKSRLMQELQATALVNGTLVLRGQALDAGGRSFAMWRNVLREAALHVQLDDLQASVLMSLVDDLDVLLGRTITAAPQLDQEGNFRRFMRVVELVFARLKRPTLVLLEDVHWATPASVAVLRALMVSVPRRTCLLVCSLRSDKRPSWIAELQGCMELPLAPFDRSEIASLCEAMLGGSESVAALVDPLQEVCDGNPFYIVELLRSLAEQRGSLVEAATALRERALDANPEHLLEVRLGYVTKEAREVLEVAAVFGRQLDLPLLGAFHEDVGRWLRHCAAARIIEVVENTWRFSHDKLRERLLEQMPTVRRRRLHGQIARQLERLHPSDKRAHALAYHYDEAGERERALPHLLLAAEQSLSLGAVHQAWKLAGRAYDFDPQGDEAPLLGELQRARALRVLIESSQTMALFDETLKYIDALLGLIGCRLCGSRAERLRCVVRCSLWSLGSAAGNPAIRQLLGRHGHTVLAVVLDGLAEGARFHTWMGNRRELTYLLLLAHGISHALGHTADVALSRGGVAYGLSMTPLRRLSLPILNRAREVLQNRPNSRRQSVLLEISGLAAINLGEWENARRHFEALLTLSEAMGDERRRTFAHVQLCLSAQLRGDLDAVDVTLQKLSTHMDTEPDHVQRTMVYGRQGWMKLYCGDYQAAVDAFCGALADRTTRMIELSVRGGLALARYLAGQRSEAFEIAEDALVLTQSSRITGHGGVLAWPCNAFVLIERWRETGDQSHREAAAAAVAEVKRLARLLPIASSSHLRLRGRLLRLQGQHRKAARSLRAAVRTASKHHMHIDRLMAELEWAAVHGECPPRRSNADRARGELRGRRALGCLRMAGEGPADAADAVRD